MYEEGQPSSPQPRQHGQYLRSLHLACVWLGASALAIVAASFVGPRIVPLYDGLGFPDQPYQYVGQANAPQTVRQDFSATELTGPGVTVQSAESGPQVKLVLAHGAVALPGDTGHVTISATPKAITAQPPSGAISGNVYLIAADTGSGPLPVKAGFGAVYLRLPQNVSLQTPPVMVFRSPGGQWRQLSTNQTGADIYSASFAGWGEYALALGTQAAGRQATTATPKPGKSSLWLPVLIIGLIAGIIVVIRIANTPKHARAKKP